MVYVQASTLVKILELALFCPPDISFTFENKRNWFAHVSKDQKQNLVKENSCQFPTQVNPNFCSALCLAFSTDIPPYIRWVHPEIVSD